MRAPMLLDQQGKGEGCLGVCRLEPLFLTLEVQPATRPRPGDSPMNNSSFFTADQSTHLKIVVVSLLASIVVMAVGIAARPPAPSTAQALVYKPQPVVATQLTGATAIR